MFETLEFVTRLISKKAEDLSDSKYLPSQQHLESEKDEIS